ncbi:FFAR3 protein, partial [Catharus fuscescens]|nr:FFAR3 protein [Catharus fuscescens]
PPEDLLDHLKISLTTCPSLWPLDRLLDHRATMSAALVLTVYILTFTVGFPANVFTLAVLVAKSRRRPAAPPPDHPCPVLATLTTADLLLLNLTAADLLLLLVLPFKMAEAAAGLVWPLPAALCPVANFCFYT